MNRATGRWAGGIGLVLACLFGGLIWLALQSPAPLFLTLAAGQHGGAKIFLLLGADPDATAGGWVSHIAAGATPMHAVAALDDPTGVDLLCAHGANPSPRDALGLTPLHVAATQGQLEVLEALIRCGAIVDATSPTHGSALLPAALWGHNEIVRRLIEVGADPRISTEAGVTPLFVAARRGRLQAATALIGAGAEINQQTAGRQWTPLAAAADQGHANLVGYLLSLGAKPCIPSANGRLALDLASARDHEVAAALLATVSESCATVGD